MRFLRLLALFFILGIAGTVWSADNPPIGWQQMTALSGTWHLANPKNTKEAAFRINYRLISQNTALVETFGDPAKQVTETVYHLDGDRLLATHYCAQGNQPRLRLVPNAGRQELVFEFVDATNLKSNNDSHLIRMRFQIKDDRHLVRWDVYSENGVEDETMLTLVRD